MGIPRPINRTFGQAPSPLYGGAQLQIPITSYPILSLPSPLELDDTTTGYVCKNGGEFL
jgi:hypothetical protein